MDNEIAIQRVETLIPVLDPQLRSYLQRVITEAKAMQVVRDLCAGNIDLEGDKQ